MNLRGLLWHNCSRFCIQVTQLHHKVSQETKSIFVKANLKVIIQILLEELGQPGLDWQQAADLQKFYKCTKEHLRSLLVSVIRAGFDNCTNQLKPIKWDTFIIPTNQCPTKTHAHTQLFDKQLVATLSAIFAPRVSKQYDINIKQHIYWYYIYI